VLQGDVLQSADGRSEALASWRGRRVHAVAGIGHPRRFFDSLRDNGLDVVEHAFPDHHAYAEEDLYFAERLPIVMTEKDWVKCERLAPANAWYLPVRADGSPGIMDGIDRLLAARMGDRRE
jgi:tetraacyldisaccharide 4'-kinase